MNFGKLKLFLWNFAKEYIPNRSLFKKLKYMYKYSIPCHKNAVSSLSSLFPHADWILRWTTIKPAVLFEIGANYAQDIAGLACYLGAQNKNVYCFEAVPEFCKEISKFYKFNVYNFAVYNHNDGVKIQCVDTSGKSENSGVSSILKSKYHKKFIKKEISVPSIRMDDFMNEHNIDSIDFIKLDVEGCTFEVLEGFGERIKDVKAIHLEAEDIPIWEGQKLFSDIEELLKSYDFEMVYYKKFCHQSDSLWVQKEYLKK